MRKFKSSQKDESRAQSADSSKAYRKISRAFNCRIPSVAVLWKQKKKILPPQSNISTAATAAVNSSIRSDSLLYKLHFDKVRKSYIAYCVPSGKRPFTWSC